MGADFLEKSCLLSKELLVWKDQVFGNINRRKKRIWARLEGIQSKLVNAGSMGLLMLEKKLRIELENILLQEEMIWFQKSRCDWIASGDRNTKYYHLALVIKGQRKRIDGLEDSEGNWISDDATLKNMAIFHFQKLYCEDIVDRPSLPKGQFPPIDQNVLVKVTRPITFEDVREALFQMSPYKASGLDGFPVVFYQ